MEIIPIGQASTPKLPQCGNIAAHKTTKLQGGGPTDYRVKKMVRLSDQKGSTDWEELRGQWEILWVVRLNSRRQDDFNNYPRIIYFLYNVQTGNEVEMGRYDVGYLFPNKRHELRLLEQDSRQQEGIIESLTTAHFRLVVQEVLRRLTSAKDVDIAVLRDSVASLVFLSELLNSEERARLREMVYKLSEDGGAEGLLISDSDLHFLVYKPFERCITYKRLGKLFPHLKLVVDSEIADKLVTWRSHRALTVFMTWSGSTAHKQLEADVKKEREKLQRTRDLSYLGIYKMECKYREETNQPPVFE